jgi:hypothetical protein
MAPLRIRKEQFGSLSVESQSRFEDRVVDFISEHYDEATELDRAEFRAVVQEQVHKAQRYGLETEEQIATYVHSAWLLGQDFDTRFPAASEQLSSPVFTPQEKSDWLAAWTKMLFETLTFSE